LDQICPTKPLSVNRLASISPHTAPRSDSDLIIVALEGYTQWQYETPGDDLTTYNPTEGPFRCIHDAFNSSIASEKILLNAIVLPGRQGTSATLTLQGTSSLTIDAARNNKHPLDGDNWVPGMLTDQSAYRSKLAGIAGILSGVAIIIQHYSITK
jgi:hypothetical protein